MSFTVTATFATAAEAAAFLTGATPVATTTKAANKKTETPASVTEPAAIQSTAPVAAAQPEKAATSAAPAGDLDYENDIKPRFLEMIKVVDAKGKPEDKLGRVAGKAILAEFGFKNTIAEATKEQYHALLAAINAKIAG